MSVPELHHAGDLQPVQFFDDGLPSRGRDPGILEPVTPRERFAIRGVPGDHPVAFDAKLRRAVQAHSAHSPQSPAICLANGSLWEAIPRNVLLSFSAGQGPRRQKPTAGNNPVIGFARPLGETPVTHRGMARRTLRYSKRGLLSPPPVNPVGYLPRGAA